MFKLKNIRRKKYATQQEIGRNIREHMKRMGVSYAALADMLNLPRATLYRKLMQGETSAGDIVYKKRRLHIDELLKISDALKVPVEKLTKRRNGG